MMDNKASLHIFSVYNVPFDTDTNIGMNWTYSLERLPSPQNLNSHIVQVTSGPRNPMEDIKINAWTNQDTHSIAVRPDRPIILYIEVKLNNIPIIDAQVIAEIRAINQSGFILPVAEVQLWDNGNGDPDIMPGDGIYSKYLSFVKFEGRYSIKVKVSNKKSRAFVYETSFENNTTAIEQRKLGQFSRISKGNSFRIESIFKVTSNSFPPSRVMDLMVDVHTSNQQLEFSWTAPGDNYDEGKPTSYQLFYSNDPVRFFKHLKSSTDLVESFSAIREAGKREHHKIVVKEFNQNLFYALLAVDNEGNVGQISNVVKAYMPKPHVIGHSVRSQDRLREGLFNPLKTAGEPNKVIMYVIVGIVAVVIFCFLVVMIVVLMLRKKSTGGSTSSDEQLSHHDTLSKGGETPTPGYTIDDPESAKEPESSKFLINQIDHYNSLQRSDKSSYNGSENNIFPHGSIHSHSTYGWVASTNPYIYKDQDTYGSLPTYKDFQANENTYIRGYQPSPTYAKPIPKSMRTNNCYQTNGQKEENPAIIVDPQDQKATKFEPSMQGIPEMELAEEKRSSHLSPTKSILKKNKEEVEGECGVGGEVRSPSATDTVSSQQSTLSSVIELEAHSPENQGQYLETSFDLVKDCHRRLPGGLRKVPPPTLPKPLCKGETDISTLPLKSLSTLDVTQQSLPKNLVTGLDVVPNPHVISNNSIDKRVRNCTQV